MLTWRIDSLLIISGAKQTKATLCELEPGAAPESPGRPKLCVVPNWIRYKQRTIVWPSVYGIINKEHKGVVMVCLATDDQSFPD